jgi:hypothetical protein
MKVSAQPIRMKVAAHLDELLSKSRGAVCKSAPMATALFKTAAALLEEGSTETRTHAKRILFALKRFLPASTLAVLVPQAGNSIRERRVAATLELLGPPEAPPRMAQSFAAAVSWDAAALYAEKVKVALPRREEVPPSPAGSLASAAAAGSGALVAMGSGGLIWPCARRLLKGSSGCRRGCAPSLAPALRVAGGRADSKVVNGAVMPDAQGVRLQAPGSIGSRRLRNSEDDDWAERGGGGARVSTDAIAC